VLRTLNRGDFFLFFKIDTPLLYISFISRIRSSSLNIGLSRRRNVRLPNNIYIVAIYI